VTWSLLAVKVGTLNTHGVCTVSLQAAVHPLTGPHTKKKTNITSEGGIVSDSKNFMQKFIKTLHLQDYVDPSSMGT
jgi:hypothetical protein